MKLFGSKNAFVREKLRRTAAASSQIDNGIVYT